MEALYYGKILPWERRVRMSDERAEIEKEIESERKYFIEEMSSDDRERFEKLENLYLNVCNCDDADIYNDGFTVGMLLMLEVLENTKNIINE